MRKLSRKILSALLALALLVSLLPAGVAPAQAADSGYSFDVATGTLTITSKDGINNFKKTMNDAEKAQIKHLVVEGDNITFPSNFSPNDTPSLVSLQVTGDNIVIDYNAFRNSSTLTTVEISGEGTKIVQNAFQNCTALRTVQITGSCDTIGAYAFSGCTALTTVVIKLCKRAGSDLFNGCTNIKSLVYMSTLGPGDPSQAFYSIPKEATILLPDDYTGSSFQDKPKAKYTLDEKTGALTITSVPEGATTIYYPSQMGNVTITSVQLANGVLDDVSLESVEVTMDLPKEPEQIDFWQYVDSGELGENNTLSLTFFNPPSMEYVEGLLPKTITATVNGKDGEEEKTLNLIWTSDDAYPTEPTYEVFEKSYTYVARVPGYSFPEGTAPTITIQLKSEDEALYKPGAVREIALNGSMPKDEFLAYLPSEIAQIDASGKVTYVPVTWECLSYSYVNSNSTTTIKTGGDYEFEATAKNKVDKLSSNVTYTLRAKQTMIEMRISPNWKVQKATTRSGESEGKITWTDKNGETYNITIDGYTGNFYEDDYIYIDRANAELVEYNSSSDQGKHVYRVEVTIEGKNAENAEPKLGQTTGYCYLKDYNNKNNVTAISNIPESYLIDAEPGKATFAIMTVINEAGSLVLNFYDGFTFHSSSGTQHTFTLNGDVGDGRTYDMAFAEGSGSSASVNSEGKQFFTVTPPDNDRAWAVLLLDSDDVDKGESSGVTIDTSWHSQVVVNFSSGIRYFYNSLFKNSKDQFTAVYLNRDMTAVVSEISLSPQSTPVETGLNDKAELAVTAEYKYKNAMPNVTYQWYKCDDVSGSNPVAIDGATSATYTPPTDKAGNYYYYAAAKFEPFTQINGYSDEAGNVLQDYDPYGWASDAVTKSSVMTLTVGEQSSVDVDEKENTYNYGDTILFDYVKVNFGDSTSDERGTMSIYRVNDDGPETLLGSEEISSGAYLSFTYDTANKGLSIGKNKVRIKFEGNETYLPSEDTLTITLKQKEVQAVVTDESITKVYDGTNKATVNLGFEAGAILDGDNVTVSAPDATYSDANVGDNKTVTLGNLSIAGDDAEWYTVTAPTETITGSITPADQTALTISGLPDKVYVGDHFTLTASGGTGEGALTWQVVSGPAEIDASTGAVRVTGEGEIKIRVTKAKDATHSATSAEITFTANEIPYTGKYSYEISTDIGDNGAITVDRYATEGERVTITVSPDEAYKLDDLSVTAHGKEVTLTDNGDGTFSFMMPSGDVRITATFAEDPDWTPDEPEEPSTDVSEIFIDVAPNAWYKDAVQYAYDNGLMTGVSATEFAPEATTTRAMIVSILARLEGVTSAEAAGFGDVNDEWYATAVNWAANVGVVNGYEDNTFRPNQPITREQLAAILMNYASYKGEDVSARADLSNYTDQPSAWATETMQWAVAEGLISGVTADQLQPQGNATRAQVAAILERFLAQ